MDEACFDAMTRDLAGGVDTRRGMLRLLAGGTLAAVAARLGLWADVLARRRRRKRQTEDGNANGLHEEGKRKGKKDKKSQKKKRKNRENLPPSSCGSGRKRCSDGSCISPALCCPGERMCVDGSCLAGACCPDERMCADGSCAGEDACCSDEHRCGEGPCIPIHQCCSDEKRCEDGTCVSKNACCDDAIPPLCSGECEAVVCDNGDLVCRNTCGCDADQACRPGYTQDPFSCACECPGGGPGCGYYCCPNSHPICLPGEGFYAGCTNDRAEWACPPDWVPWSGPYCRPPF